MSFLRSPFRLQPSSLALGGGRSVSSGYYPAARSPVYTPLRTRPQGLASSGSALASNINFCPHLSQAGAGLPRHLSIQACISLLPAWFSPLDTPSIICIRMSLFPLTSTTFDKLPPSAQTPVFVRLLQ